MKRLFIGFTLAWLLAAVATAQTFRVADIRVEGLQRVSAGPVFAALPMQSGDVVDETIVRDAIRSLFATGLFSEVDIAREGDILIVQVQERPAISELTIEGNKAIKTEMLTDVMSEQGLEEGEILQQEALEALLRELRRQYIAQGRYGASVEADITDKPNNQVQVEIKIDEGDKSGIRHLNIVGNTVYDDETLREAFESTETNWLSWMTSDDAYAREKLQGDIEILESYYLDRGYLDFQVESTQVSLSPEKDSVYITMNVSEGDRYRVSSVKLAGDPVLSEQLVMRLLSVREGQTYSQRLVTRSSEYIKNILGNTGYMNASVEGIPERNADEDTVALTFFIDPGERAYIRRILFSGNTTTADSVLRREMRQMERAPASNADIEQGKVRLERLGFFSQVEVETNEVPSSPDLVDVTYTVEEQPSGSFQASLGYAERSGFMVGASVQQSNWLGTGKQVGLSVNTSDYQTSYQFSYLDPYFTPDGVSRGFNLYYRETDYERIGVSSYSTDAYGLGLTFGYPLSEIQRLGLSLGLNNLTVQTGPYAVQEIRSSPRGLDLDNGNYVYVTPDNYLGIQQIEQRGIVDIDNDGVLEEFTFQTLPVTAELLPNDNPGFIDKYGDSFTSGTATLSWSRSTLNRGMLPTRGNSQQFQIEVALPGGDLQYYKARLDAQMFLPLNRHFTLRLRTDLGYGDGYGDLEDLPFFENFYGGGFGSVRGFRRSTLGPDSTPALQYVTVPYDYDMVYDAEGNPADIVPTSDRAFVLCDIPEGRSTNACRDGKLLGQPISANRGRSIGGNVLVEFGMELIMPIPFIDDQSSTQFAAFLDAGNVFDTDCGRYQENCYDISADRLSAAVGFGLTWISGFGPLTFSVAKPIKSNPGDEEKSFQFIMGAGF